MTSDAASTVRKWFDTVGQADGPLLPDGWFGGRPRENSYFLEDVQLLGDALVVQLSEETTLRFDGPGRVFVEDSDLVFDGFRRATIRWRDYGGGRDLPYHERIYDVGQVRLAAPTGTRESTGHI
jgi:hypothetical protein